MPSIINASSTGTGGIVQTADASGVLQLQCNGTAAININSINQVSIATTNTGGALTTTTTTGNWGVLIYDQANNASMLQFRNVSGAAAGNISLSSAGATSILLSSVAGVNFPATQVASADANTLDDYEEGTFTPSYSLGSGSGTFTTQIATYTKIGRIVTLSMRFVGSSVSSAANLAVAGLPFAFANSNADSSGAFREYTTLGNLYILSFGSSTDVSMQRYDNSNGLPNGAPAWSGTFTYTTN